MSEIGKRALTRRAMIHAGLAAMYPALLGVKPAPAPFDRSAIVLGRNQGGAPIMLPQRPRREHTHVIGTTGGGKSKFCEHCIR
jgi:type IV secretory pathway VirB4 component